MNRRFILIAALVCLLALAALTTGLVHAATASNYDLTWWSVDGGGGVSNSTGSYSLGGTIGQPDAGGMSDTGYSLAGGFWAGVGASLTPPSIPIYLPLVKK